MVGEKDGGIILFSFTDSCLSVFYSTILSFQKKLGNAGLQQVPFSTTQEC
jgi:hypothetical protein